MIIKEKQVRWACKRGMLELDLLLNNFVNHVYKSLTKIQKQHFYNLLQLEDQELFNALYNNKKLAIIKLQEIIQLIKQSSYKYDK